MTKLDAVIKDIEAVNKMGNAWIYDADGNIKDDVSLQVISFPIFVIMSSNLLKKYICIYNLITL